MTDPRQAAEAMREAAAEAVRDNKTSWADAVAAIRALPLPDAPAHGEDVVERVAQSVPWQMALTDVIEEPTRRDLERALIRAALAAMPQQGWREKQIAWLNVEALAEIKAVVDGESSQSIRTIVYGLLEEIAALPAAPSPETGNE